MFGRRRSPPPPPPAPVKRSQSPFKPAVSAIKPAAFIQPETPPPSAKNMDRMQQQNMDRMQQQMNAQKAAADQFNASRDNLMNMQKAGQLSAQDMDRMQQEMDAQRGRFKSGGKVGSASKRADGIAQRGKTKGRYI